MKPFKRHLSGLWFVCQRLQCINPHWKGSQAHPPIYIILYIFYTISMLNRYGFIHFSHWNIHHMINALFGNFSIPFKFIPTNSGAIFRWSTKIGFDDYIEKVVVVFTTKFLRPYFVSCAKNFRFMIFPRPIH